MYDECSVGLLVQGCFGPFGVHRLFFVAMVLFGCIGIFSSNIFFSGLYHEGGNISVS